MTQFIAQPIQEVNTTTAGDQTAPSIAFRADGGYAIVWGSGSGADAGVYVQVYDASGAKVGTERAIFLDSASPLANWSGFQPGGVAGLADGSFVVTASANWVDPNSGPKSAVYSQRLDSMGIGVGITELVDGTGQYDYSVSGGPIVATADGGYWVEVMEQSRPTPQILFSPTCRNSTRPASRSARRSKPLRSLRSSRCRTAIFWLHGSATPP